VAKYSFIMMANCRRPSSVLSTMLKKPGMAPSWPTRRPAGVSITVTPRP
jgi:hypothetical protein